MTDVLPVYIGWDEREQVAADVCRFSIERRASTAVYTQAINRTALEYAGLYRRKSFKVGSQQYDAIDGKPFSTDFSFTRFLVPALQQYTGWALFVDCDFLFLADVAEVFKEADPSYAVMCVQHRHEPPAGVKMDGVQQTRYRRKNWSSLVLWNCGHRSNKKLTVERVNTEPGAWLHGFNWLADDEIGALDPAWNWLSGYSGKEIEPKAIHYTEGGPWFEGYKDVPRAGDWFAEWREMASA